MINMTILCAKKNMFMHMFFTYISFTAHRGIFSVYYKIKPNFDCDHPFPIDLALNRIPPGKKAIGKR